MSSFSSKAMMDSSFITGPRAIVPPGPTPLVLDKHFDFLDWSPDGELLLLGTSSLTSRTWGGSIWIFSHKDVNGSINENGYQPKAENCLVGASMDCGVCVGRFLRCSDMFVVGCDSGTIQLISSKTIAGPEKMVKLEGEASLSEHNDMVLDLDDLGGDGLNFVSCSQDKSIKIWDFESLVSTHTFSPAHAHIVTSVRARPNQSSSFASCARDGSALLWDIREERPASSIVDRSGIGLTSLAWVDDLSVVVGTINGHLTTIDIRNSSESLGKVQLENRPIYSMKSNPTSLDYLAVCQDSSKISVFKFKKGLDMMFDDDSHGDFVRGLGWNPNSLSLWSCGWDSKIFCHHIKVDANGQA